MDLIMCGMTTTGNWSGAGIAKTAKRTGADALAG